MPNSLRPLLHEWQVKPLADPDFAAKILQRIAERKGRLSYRVQHSLDEIVNRPAGAALTIALVVLAGFAAGNAWQQQRTHNEQIAGRTAYMLAVNPVARAAALQR